MAFVEIDAGGLQYVFRGVVDLKGEAELLGDLRAVIDQDRKCRAGGPSTVGRAWCGLRRHRNQVGVGVGQERSSFEQPTKVDIAVSAPGAPIEDHDRGRAFPFGKMLAQTPHSALW